MARSTNREADLPLQRTKMMQIASAEGEQMQDSHGPDPWQFVDCRKVAADSKTSTAAESTTQASTPNLKSQLLSHFGRRERETNNKTTPTIEGTQPRNDEDNIALPTPIQAAPWKLVAPDGHVQHIYEPIVGFEHLFKAPSSCQGVPSSSSSADAHYLAGQPQYSQTPGTPPHAATHSGTQHTRSKNPHEIRINLRKKVVAKTAKRNVLKRTRSVAQGLSQPSSVREVSDDGVRSSTNAGDDEADKEVSVVTETSRTFHVGDIAALKVFFRQRIDELTMKPVRGMVTSWVKQLEPKRKGGYGPYHKMLPSDAPDDATPPWWPRDVPYVEPAHLDKDGLLTLAVDIMLQHRDIPIDEYKRRQSWTHKLRQVAQFEIEMTPQEQYSSSRNPAFSALMKQRAEKDILPSLFDVSQSYEDHVIQYGLWTYQDLKDIPKGKEITWQFIARPPKQVSRFKRPRPAPQPKVKREFVVEALAESTEDDTEPDDTMYKLAAQIMRRKEAREARRKAKVPAAEMIPITPASSIQPISRESTIEAPSPMFLSRQSVPATPQPSVQQVSSPDDAKCATSSSFDQSMNHLRLQDEGNAAFTTPEGQAQAVRHAVQPCEQPLQYNAIPGTNNSCSQLDQEDAKESNFATPADCAQQARCNTQALDDLIHQRMNFQTSQAGLANSPYHPLQTPGSFSDQKGGSYMQFTPHHFVDPAQLSMFNNAYSLQMSHAYDHTMAANPPQMSYPYESDAPYHTMDVMSTATSPQAATNFNGLPYEYSGPQH